MTDLSETPNPGSIVLPDYATGAYFADASRHSEDLRFKAEAFLRFFPPVVKRTGLTITSYADVGCGSGQVIKLVADGLRSQGFVLTSVKGYDVYPQVASLQQEGVTFVCADFCQTEDFADLVTLFDVFEHVPDPLGFIRLAAERSYVLGFHIPLDASLNTALRDRYRVKLNNPGHLVFLDTSAALNLLALAGLRVFDYQYTFAFQAPSGRTTGLSKLALAVRAPLARLNPWLMSKTVGGASLLVVALTARGLQAMARVTH